MAKKRKDGRYQASFMDSAGQRHWVYARTKKELPEKIAQKKADLEAAKVSRVNPTLEEFYEEFTDRRRNKVSSSTVRTLDYIMNTIKAIPMGGQTFGEMRLRDITKLDVIHVQAALAKKHAPKTVNIYMTRLKQVFKSAVDLDVIEKNPCSVVEPIKQTGEKITENRHRALTQAETAAFFAAAKGSYYYNCFAMMVKTGMRIGEVSALTETDIDMKSGTVHVRRTVTRTERGWEIGDTTKTRAGVRDIPVGQDVLDIVRAQKEQNLKMFGFDRPKTLFPAVTGGLIPKMSANREIEKICKAAGIDRFTCHALRDTFATMFLEQRPEDYKILSEILGHSDISMTLNLYCHVMQDKKVSAMRAVNIAI